MNFKFKLKDMMDETGRRLPTLGEDDNNNENTDFRSSNVIANAKGNPLKCRYGGVSSSQPLASKAGLDILRKGGNAAGQSLCYQMLA